MISFWCIRQVVVTLKHIPNFFSMALSSDVNDGVAAIVHHCKFPEFCERPFNTKRSWWNKKKCLAGTTQISLFTNHVCVTCCQWTCSTVECSKQMFLPLSQSDLVPTCFKSVCCHQMHNKHHHFTKTNDVDDNKHQIQFY